MLTNPLFNKLLISFIISVVLTLGAFSQERTDLGDNGQNGNQPDILSIDYKTAEKALGEAIADGDMAKIRLFLRNSPYFLGLKNSAVLALENLNDRASVPNLIWLLENNQGIIGGGAEALIDQRNLNINLIYVLEYLTKIDFGFSKPLVITEIDKILDIRPVVTKSRKWWALNGADMMSFKLDEKAVRAHQESSVLRNDIGIARKAVLLASESKDLKALWLALSSRFLLIRKLAVEGIRNLDDKTSTLRLIEALENNQGFMPGGIPTAILQRDLSVTIIETLQQFTKLDFGILKPLDRNERDDRQTIEKVVKESRKWWDMNKEKISHKSRS